ncbi:MAG: CRISPR-associated helicase Cas3' [Dehalococcoidia bacterium]
MESRPVIYQRMAELFGHRPYDFQVTAVTTLLKGQSVVLRAPTGSGKTDVALAPTLLGRLLDEPFPRQMVYSVQMRVLATQFRDKTKKLLADGAKSGAWPLAPPSLAVQNSERREDSRFESDFIFTTIDQALASYLNIPYGLPSRQGNLNAGALATAHFVADEFHLFDVDAALRTTVDMLRVFRGGAPFLLMTATCSNALFQFLAHELRATLVEPGEDELRQMASQQKSRIYEASRGLLTAAAVLDRHNKRSIAVCNTVERAQDLYEALDALHPNGVEIRLLHARFLSDDRSQIEDWCRQTFAEGWETTVGGNAILVATQAVEVGLDMTCEVLHTELAPASAIVQRAGRCARYEGETGHVIVYDPPPRDDGSPNYSPYLEESELEAVTATMEALGTLLSGPASYKDELTFVEQAHGAGDATLCESIATTRAARRMDVADTIRHANRSRTRDLIRESDSRTLLVLANPDECGNPYGREGFSFQTDTLQGRIRGLLTQSTHSALWTIKVPREQESEGKEYGVVTYRWEAIDNAMEVRANPVLAVNPVLIHYDKHVGFRFRPGTPCESPLLIRQKEERPRASYHLTPYPVHICGLYSRYRRDIERLQIGERLVAAACHTEPEVIDRLVKACLALHDAGKLTAGWVAWATAWQRMKGELGPGQQLPFLVSHTDYDSEGDRGLTRQVQPPRPNHAAESAWIGSRVVERLAEGRRDLAGPALAAIARHHSPTISKSGAYRLERRALSTLNEAMLVVGLPAIGERELYDEASAGLAAPLVWRSEQQLLLYFFLVRVLRQADQKSFEELQGLGL